MYDTKAGVIYSVPFSPHSLNTDKNRNNIFGKVGVRTQLLKI